MRFSNLFGGNVTLDPIPVYTTTEVAPRVMPFRCPVCLGTRYVPTGFYLMGNAGVMTTASTLPCQSCDGKGIVWTPERV